MPRHGLYVLTDSAAGSGETLAAAVAAAVAGGAVLVQYRDKGGDRRRRRLDVEALLVTCRAAGVPLIVNDDVELAVACGADGVHLGRDDASPVAARARLGDGAIIGVSCYDQPARALAAQAAGADYVAFGRFFASGTKPLAVQATQQTLRDARLRLHLPVVAIGGITPGNAAPLVAAGADLLAVVGAVMRAPDVRAAAAAFAPLFDPPPNRKAV